MIWVVSKIYGTIYDTYFNLLPMSVKELVLQLIEMEGKAIKKIGKYTLGHQLLGAGSFSTVYLAYDAQERPFAVKVIPLSAVDSSHKAFEEEISCLRKCSHENVVQLLDIMKTKNNLYLFMEFCSQGTLQQLLMKKGPLSEEQALSYFSQIVRGLQVLSAAGVIHRDLKPANILIKDKTIKIADFGLARKYHRGELLSSYKGTPLNMAPQILQGCDYTDKVDVYSAGTILYQMLFGCYPFIARTEEEIADKIKHGLKMKSDIKVSKAVRKLLTDMLQAVPSRRINLNGVLDFIQRYGEIKLQEKLKMYRTLANSVNGGAGVMGALLSVFNWNEKRVSPSSISTMDLRLYGRLCSKLSPRG